ncbi:DUF4274 domain-containing protein [Altererythrobacter fulvus]|uniref:DUF4274 domain-containing protein n=1 Tax=Caenibius fulvus TaxID=2126012 RepID=UPI003019BA3D
MEASAPPVCGDYDKKLVEKVEWIRSLPREGNEESEGATFLTWLREESTPADWHHIAHCANWDFVEPVALQWIASREDCDLATALILFWKASPEYFLKAGRDRMVLNGSGDPNSRSDTLEHFDMIEYIRERWENGGYKRSEFSFDYDNDIWANQFAEIDAKYGDDARKYLPQGMRTRIDGKQLSEIAPSEGYDQTQID